MNISKSTHLNHKYALENVRYIYSYDHRNNICIESNEGDLEIGLIEHDTNEHFEADERDIEYWVGHVLFWYDAGIDPTDKNWTVYVSEQIDAIARLSLHLGYVPDLNSIKQYAVPSPDEFYTYYEMLAKLLDSGEDKAKVILSRIQPLSLPFIPSELRDLHTKYKEGAD